MKTILWTFPVKEDVEDVQRCGYKVCGIFPKITESTYREQQKLDAIKVCENAVETDEIYGEKISPNLLSQLQQLGDFKYAFSSAIDKFQCFHQVLCQKLGFQSNVTATKTVQDKFRLREFLSQNETLKELNPRYFAAANILDLEQILATVDYPVVVKPRTGSLSQNISISKSRENTQEILSNWRNRDFPTTGLVVEVFISGTQYSVETLSLNGQAMILGITEKFSVQPPHFVEVGGIFPAPLSGEVRSKIAKVISELLKSLNHGNEFSHTEIFVTNRDEVKIVECHLRRPGMIPKLFREVYGVSWYEFQLQCLKQNKLLPLPAKENQCAFVEVFEFCEGQEIGDVSPALQGMVSQFNLLLKPGEISKSVTSNMERHGHFIATANSPDEVHARIIAVRKVIAEELGQLREKQR